MRKNFKKEKKKRSMLDGLSTRVFDKNGKTILRGMDYADADSASSFKKRR